MTFDFRIELDDLQAKIKLIFTELTQIATTVNHNL